MNITRLYGGIGNQLFQYAALLHACQQNGAPGVIDESWLKPAQRGVIDVLFRNVATASTWDRFKATWIPWPGRPYAKLLRAVGRLNPNIVSDSAIPRLRTSPHVYLSGYFQTAAMVESVRVELLNHLRFELSAQTRRLGVYAAIQSSNSVALHIRRGDYVTNSNAARLHGVLDRHYYDGALRLIRCRVGESARVFIFSNDITWCRKNLADYRAVYVDEQISDLEELFLMAACKHNVIANSTYSWWAAWFNRNASKLVVAPARWYLDETSNRAVDVLFPTDWLRA